MAFLHNRRLPLDTSATGWDIGAVTGAGFWLRVPSTVLQGCLTSDYHDLSVVDSNADPVVCLARTVVKNAGTRSTEYPLSNKILRWNDGTTDWAFFTYNKTRQLEGYTGRPAGAASVVKFNLSTEVYEEFQFDPLLTDNHGGYCLWFDSAGKLNAVGGAHTAACSHYRSTTAYGIDLALVDANLSDAPGPTNEGGGTYPSFIPLSAGAACGVLSSNQEVDTADFDCTWHYFNGSTWASKLTVVDFGDPGAGEYDIARYANFVLKASDGRVYVFAHEYDNTAPAGGKRGYAIYTDDPSTGTPTFRACDAASAEGNGTAISLPATESTMTSVGAWALADDTRLVPAGVDAAGNVYVACLTRAGASAENVHFYRVNHQGVTLLGSLDTGTQDAYVYADVACTIVDLSGTPTLLCAFSGGGTGYDDAATDVYYATSTDGANWSAVATLATGSAPNLFPCLPMQGMGGDEPTWPVTYGHQVGGGSDDGNVRSQFGTLAANGDTQFLMSPGLEVWLRLKMDLTGNDAAQYVTINYGDAAAAAPEDPTGDGQLDQLLAFTDATFGPFGDLSSNDADGTEAGQVYKTLGVFGGVGWAADLRGTTADIVQFSAAKHAFGTGDFTIRWTGRFNADTGANQCLYCNRDVRNPSTGQTTAGVTISYVDASNVVSAAVDDGPNGVAVNSDTTHGLLDGRDHTVQLTRAGASLRLYIDGVLNGTSDAGPTGSVTNPSTYGAWGANAYANTGAGYTAPADVDMGVCEVVVGKAVSADEAELWHKSLADPPTAVMPPGLATLVGTVSASGTTSTLKAGATLGTTAGLAVCAGQQAGILAPCTLQCLTGSATANGRACNLISWMARGLGTASWAERTGNATSWTTR